MGRIGFAMRGGVTAAGICASSITISERMSQPSATARSTCRTRQLLAEADFVSVHTDLNDSTRGMFNRDAFRNMKKTAVFINTARGPLHVQRSLRRLADRRNLRRRARRHRPRAHPAQRPAAYSFKLRDRPAHRQRHRYQPQRHGRDRRRQPDRRRQGGSTSLSRGIVGARDQGPGARED